MARMEFHLNYPYFEQPKVVKDMTERFLKNIATMNLEDKLYLLMALKFFGDWRYDDNLQSLLNQIYE